MRIFFACLAVLLAAVPAMAQPPKAEIFVSGGWVFSEGIRFREGVEVDGNYYTRLEPTDGGTLGAGFGAFVNRNMEVGFLWDHQWSELEAGGTATMKISDQSLDSFHGVFIYNLGSYLDPVRPFVYGGFGATHFGGIEFTRPTGEVASLGGNTKFSTTWGAGVKWYVTPRIGLQAHLKWTPTYVKSDPGSYWCDPYWGCGVTSDPDYVNQFQLGGALLARF
jgi:hypothetical protein